MQKTFLNLGSGPRHALPEDTSLFQGWREFRIDLNPGVAPDAIASLVDLSAVMTTDAVEMTFCSHVVEHFYDHEVPQVLAEVARVLRPDGVALFRCPDLEQVMQRFDPNDLEKPLYTSAAGDITVLDVLYGHRASIREGDHYMAHRTGFTEESFAAHLLDAGFTEVRTQKSGSMDFWAVASFEWSAYRDHAELMMNR